MVKIIETYFRPRDEIEREKVARGEQEKGEWDGDQTQSTYQAREGKNFRHEEKRCEEPFEKNGRRGFRGSGKELLILT